MAYKMRPENHFAIVLIDYGHLRLRHRRSGEIIQRHNTDFAKVSDAAKVRDAMIAAAPSWDWDQPTLFEDMPAATFDVVWAAIYAA